jgi:lysophospholipase L1-like esterase
MKQSRLYALLIMSFTCIFAFSQLQQVRIGCIGNSITYGSGLSDPETESYPAQLQNLLNELYVDTCIVENFGVSGRTMLKNGDFPIWNETTFTDAYLFAPNILLILLGTNDSKPQNWDYYKHEYYDDYIAMIDSFKVRNPETKFIVCYPPPAYEIKWGIRDSVIVHGVIPAIDSVLNDRNALFVDFYTPLIDSVNLFPDMIHPGSEESLFMAQMIFDSIVKYNLIHTVETGNTYITSLKSKEQQVPVHDSATISWTTVNADSVWLEGVLVDSIGTRKIQMDQSDLVTLIAKGEKSNDTLSIFVETYVQEISRIQVDPFVATANINDEINLIVLYFDQQRLQMEDTITDITWELIEGEGEFINKNKNQVTFVVGNQPRSIIYAKYGDLTGEMRITVENSTNVNRNKTSLVNIYPNPVSDLVSVIFDMEKQGKATIKILDIKGSIYKTKTYFFENAGQKHIKIDINDIPNGVYLLQVDGSKNILSKKILKE